MDVEELLVEVGVEDLELAEISSSRFRQLSSQ
jgi:hypothetical protein